MICKCCNKEIIGKHWNSKYCKECAREKHLQQMRWHRWKQRYWGTTSFSQHPKKDFDKEIEDIKKEKKRLKLL